MISASSAIYALLLEQARNYQTGFISEAESSNTLVEIEDDDDVFTLDFVVRHFVICFSFTINKSKIAMIRKEIGHHKK